MTVQTAVLIFLLLLLLLLCYHLNKTRGLIREIIELVKGYKPCNIGALLLLKDKGLVGELAGHIATVFERNQRQVLDAEEQTRMLEATLRGMSDGVLMTDKEGTVILANRALKRLFSIRSSLEGKKIPEVIRNNNLTNLFQRAMDTWETLTEEVEVTIGDKDLHVLVTAVPMYSASSVTGIVFTIQDITRLKRLEEIRRDFVANVSHEIRTPLTAIRASAETILDSDLEDREAVIRFLGIIKSHSERLGALVDDLLTLSRIELGDMPIEKTSFDLVEALDIVIETLREKATKKGLYLRKIHEEQPCMIRGDKNKVVQIILNLIDNAIKFTEQGGVTIKVQRQSADAVLLHIEDTGIGIPRQHIERLGERFYRVDRARSRELGGTGLGLAIVKHIVGAHGWHMNIDSTVGHGTRVTITIN
jgi:two-component system phosphate regulon sensor histidine kinase PhoR